MPEATTFDYLRFLIVGTSVMGIVVGFFILSLIVSNNRLRRQHNALKKSEGKYRSLFERSKEAILLCSPEGKILDLNEAAIHLFDFSSRDEVLKFNVRSIYPQQDDFDSLVEKLRQTGFVRERELTLKRKDNTTLTVIESSTAVYDQDNRMVACQSIFHDLTEWKKLEEELFNAQKLESIATLAGGIAHDFNNVLAVVLMNAQFGMEDAQSSPGVQERFQEIKKAAAYASELTSKLLTFSRRNEFAPEPIQLNDMLREHRGVFESLLGESISLTFDLDEKLPLINATAVQIQQIAINMAANAHDAMPSGGKLTITTRKIPAKAVPFEPNKAEQANHYVMLKFADNGVGMDKVTLSRVFEPFYTTKEVGKGTGLGLAVVHGIVERHRGFVEVTSQPGEGTQFTFYFPALAHGQAVVAKPEARPTGMVAGDKHLTVLLAEDYERLLRTNEHILKKMGFEVISTSNGEEAVAAFEKDAGRIDLAVLDVVMPRLGGVEAYQKMRVRKPNLPVLFLTGYDSGRTLDALKKVDDEHVCVLNKPYFMDELVKAVNGLTEYMTPRPEHER